MTKPLPALVVPAVMTIAALTLSACAATAPHGATTSTSAPGGSASAAAPATDLASVDAVLATAGLQGRSTEDVVAALEASTEDRTAGPVASVRHDQVVLTAGDRQVAMALPAGRTYLSIAPYEKKTHDCYNHNLATCQGELAGAQVHVTITDTAGASLVDQDVTLGANGFAGFWLPRDIRGTVTVTYAGKTATQDIATGPDDPTCLTTLKLG